MILEYKVKKDEKYKNLKEVIKCYFEISDRLLVKLKHNQKISINDKIVPINAPIYENDIIKVNIDFIEDNSNIVPTEIDLDIVYEDDSFIIVNKPAGMPVHPSMDHFRDSLSNGIKYYFDKIGIRKIIRPVNRLDKDTSGLVVFAKNEYIQECFVKQMKTNQFKKEYLAVCEGIFESKKGTIDLPIARKSDSIIERCVDSSGIPAITHYEVINESTYFSVVKCVLETGRTHQIRVHMAHIGHPLLGDTLYGSTSPLISRQALHAFKIYFIHPIHKKRMEFTAIVPNDIKKITSL